LPRGQKTSVKVALSSRIFSFGKLEEIDGVLIHTEGLVSSSNSGPATKDKVNAPGRIRCQSTTYPRQLAKVWSGGIHTWVNERVADEGRPARWALEKPEGTESFCRMT